MSWTPGPWKAVQRKDGYDHDLWDVQGPDGEFLASGSIYHQGPDNARLIAAAPEMAAFLERWWYDPDNPPGYVPALLARIRGEDQRPEGVANASSK